METKIITTPVGKEKVELKSFITGREKRELKGVFLRGMKLEMDGKKAKSNQVDMEKLTNDTEDVALGVIVISIGGNKENILKRVLDMSSKDYDFIVAEVNKVTQEDDFLAPVKEPNSIIEPTN